jgi:hypothetical protein
VNAMSIEPAKNAPPSAGWQPPLAVLERLAPRCQAPVTVEELNRLDAAVQAAQDQRLATRLRSDGAAIPVVAVPAPHPGLPPDVVYAPPPAGMSPLFPEGVVFGDPRGAAIDEVIALDNARTRRAEQFAGEA